MGITTATTAQRFAETSIRLFQSEGTFHIDVPEDMSFEEVTAAFEKMGCRVDREPMRRRLTVVCPD